MLSFYIPTPVQLAVRPGPRRVQLTPVRTLMVSSPAHPARVHLLKTGIEPKSATHVLYWMSTALRTNQNPSLQHASHLSRRHKLPLRVALLLDSIAPDDHPLPERHALFQLQGARDVASSLHSLNIPFGVFHATADPVSLLLKLAQGAAAIVADQDYLRRGRLHRETLANLLSIPFYVVEANVVVPVKEASDKAEHAARTIRPKITRRLSEFLAEQSNDQVNLHQAQCTSISWGASDPVALHDNDAVESALDVWQGLDREAVRVTAFEGGQQQAQVILDDFIKSSLRGYGSKRNEPSLQLQSDLSPYLRAGNISPIHIAHQIQEATRTKSNLKESKDSFLEELIVRRELAVNACWFNRDYDVYERIVPRFAQESLALHKEDKREKVYSYDELEAGVTNDVYWNAAQLELIVRGKMHGYMRMYWAKQLIGWIEDPKEAMHIGLRLNNRWELDAVDPNSYVGVIWCFGLHDQGWRERPVWGKVRYMNDAGLKRKFNMPAYVAQVDAMVAKEGLPDHITQIRKANNVKGRQTTLKEIAAKKPGVRKSGRKIEGSGPSEKRQKTK